MRRVDDKWLLEAELQDERDRREYMEEQYRREREISFSHAQQAAGEYADRMDELQEEVSALETTNAELTAEVERLWAIIGNHLPIGIALGVEEAIEARDLSALERALGVHDE